MIHRLYARAVRTLGGPGQARAVAVLASVLALDGADKGTLSTNARALKHAFGVGNTEIGLMASIVAVMAGVLTIPVGLVADRVDRTRLLAYSTALWAVATFLSGVAPSYLWLLASRAGLGAVTATAGPTVASLTGDFFPSRNRARMYGFVLGGELLGTGLGFLVSSVVGSTLGWRFAFWWLVLPSVALLWALIRLPEPPRAGRHPHRRERGPDGTTKTDRTRHDDTTGAHEPGAGETRAGSGARRHTPSTAARAVEEAGVAPDDRLVLHTDPRRRRPWWTVRYVLRVPTNRVLIAASALGYFYFAGLRSFATLFITEHYHVSTSIAGLLVLVVGAGSAVGVFTGGPVADRLMHGGRPNGRILVPVVCLLTVPLLAAPALYVSTLAAALPLLIGATALLGAVNPPLDAARLDIIHPYLWGTAEGTRSFLRTLGEAIAPTLFGYVSAHVFGGHGTGLRNTFSVFLVCLTAAAVLGMLALRSYARDVATVVTSDRAISAAERAGTG